jgi:indole-3-glycerol phosphate synthase
MTTFLVDILAEKQKVVAKLKRSLENNPESSINKILRQEQRRENKHVFKQALLAPGLSIIAEIKRRSPSKGQMAEIADPAVLAAQYLQGGAQAISVLTDAYGFSGSLDDLIQVKKIAQPFNCPVLQKDFIIDPVQIAEAVSIGADCILIIMAAVKERAQELIATARVLHIDALVEVNNKQELDMAIDYGAEIIGVNNRNLHTFVEDIQTSLQLINYIPASIAKVSASAVRSVATAKELQQAGFDALLVGELLVKAEDPAVLIKDMRAK